MPVRTQVYQGLLWQQIIDEQKPPSGARLPPLLMLVLHRGERRWKAPDTTGELIALSPDSTLWRWQPQARYYVLDMGAFPRDELARRSGLVTLLFRLEQRQSADELEELVGEVRVWFRRHAQYKRLQKLFVELIRRAGVACGAKTIEIRNIEENNVLLENMKAYKEQWLAVGRAEGKAEGKAEALICLLTKKFGGVGPSRERQIRGANLEILERWFKRAIASTNLRSVFNSARRAR